MTEEEIKKIKEKLEEHENRIFKLESLFQAKSEIAKKKLSFKEFILSKKPKDDVQKTLAMGYYLEKHEGFSLFNVRDLEKRFKAAKELVPKNTNDKINLNIKKGHIMEAREKKDNLKAWVLTDSGEKYVENNFKKKK